MYVCIHLNCVLYRKAGFVTATGFTDFPHQECILRKGVGKYDSMNYLSNIKCRQTGLESYAVGMINHIRKSYYLKQVEKKTELFCLLFTFYCYNLIPF